MARIRTVKPEFWQDEDIALLHPQTQLLAIGLLNHSDDKGYFKAHTQLVRSTIFPFTDHSLNVHGMLTELSNIGYIELFEGSDGKPYGMVKNFTKHQKVNRPQASKIEPFRGFTERSLNDHGTITDGKEQGTGNREQGKEHETPEAITKTDYAFSGETIKLDQVDYDKAVELFPNLNLPKELKQIDFELRGDKKWFASMNMKLNYRNKQAQGRTPLHVVNGYDHDDRGII